MSIASPGLTPMFVAREWRAGDAQDEVRNSFSGQVVGSVPRGSVQDALDALDAAERGARTMRALTAYERLEILERAAVAMEGAVESFAQLISAESGKPVTEARAEAGRIAALIRLSASEGARMHGETVPVEQAANGAGKIAFTMREPCGIVVAISPFNFPLLLVAHKVLPALACGNAVILKPARSTPLTALALTRLLLEAGIPEDAMQCLTGSGAQLGDVLCRDPRVRKISFTGSTEVGESIASVAGVKRLSLELGANCPLIVLPDADVELAAAATAVGGYANAGQVCISVQRALVAAPVYADYLDALKERVERIQVGDPSVDATQLAGLIDEREAIRVETSLRGAVTAGAWLVTGGERDGAVVTPAVVADVEADMPLAREELFGPAVAVGIARDLDHALTLANDSPYGLAAGIFTRDVTAAMRFARLVEAGNVMINSTPLWRADVMPYGGVKGSGIGKEGPQYAIEEMTELKTVVFHGV